METPIAYPFEFDNLLQGIGLENFNLFWIRTERHQTYVLVFLFAIICYMIINLGKQINAKLYLEHFGAILNIVFFCEFSLWKYQFIIVVELVKWTFVVADTLFIIGMVSGPIIIIKNHREHITFQDGLDRDALFQQNWEVLEEQVAGYKVVLVFNNVWNHIVHSPYLVGLQSRINGSEVVEAFTSFLLDFIFVDDWKLSREVLLMVVLKKICDGPAFES